MEIPLPHPFPGPINWGEGGREFLHFSTAIFWMKQAGPRGPRPCPVPHILFASFIHSITEHLLCAQLVLGQPAEWVLWGFYTTSWVFLPPTPYFTCAFRGSAGGGTLLVGFGHIPAKLHPSSVPTHPLQPLPHPAG